MKTYYGHMDRGAVCLDCDLPYGDPKFGDLVVPHDVWERINPTPFYGCGLLCPNCIFARLSELGIGTHASCYPSTGEVR